LATVSGREPSPAGRLIGVPAIDDVLSDHRLGRIAEAALGYRRILADAPGNPDAIHLLGVTLSQQGSAARGAAVIGRALALRPDHPEARANRANAFALAGAHAEAGRDYRRGLALGPDAADVHFNFGNLQAILGGAEAAMPRFRRALALVPNHGQARMSLAVALRNLRRWEAAIVEFERVLAIAPERADAQEKLANILATLRRLDRAQPHGRRALVLSPGSSEALFTIGALCSLRNRSDLAVRSYRRTLAAAPDHVHAHSNLIFDMELLADVGIAEQQRERRRWYERHGRRFAPAAPVRALDRAQERRLRIGYVSPDFRHHSSAYVSGAAIFNHDRAAFEVFLYSDVAEADEMTQRFRAAADCYRSITAVSDGEVADRIRSDGIDILVDLTGHADGNRLPVFARKPAPIQVTAWGIASGTGIETIDYFFADPVVVPSEVRPLFAEEVFDLPCFLAYGAPGYAPPVAPLPGGAAPIFGCLNRMSKLSPQTLDLWSRLLAEVSGARLLLKDATLSSPQEQARLIGEFNRHGIDADRLILRGRTPHAEQLGTYGEVHVALDPFPQNGGVSTFEALWMGVPVVARLGETPAGRAASAILAALGLEAWIAETDEAYLDIAKRLAADRAGLANLRETLRPKLAASVVCDPVRYSRVVEAAYREIWRRHVRGPGAAEAPN
jgi:predicted O-linked N-acetylglucosamine transferase (SPINDLY family)